MRFIDRLLFYKLAPRQVRYLAPLDYAHAAGLARNVLDQLERDFVVGPPVTIHLPNPELMAGVWAMGRECLAADRTGREQRELVAAQISRINQCPYCFDVHGAMLHAFGHGDAFKDPALRPIAEWAAATLSPGTKAPFADAERPKLFGTAVCFHYLNRMSNVFLESAPFTFHNSAVIRMSGRILRGLVTAQQVTPGEFVSESSAPLPSEFAWAAADSENAAHIAGGLSRFAAAADAAGEESIAPDVRARVINQVNNWKGESPALGWKPPGSAVERLALLTALASWQVDKKLIEAFRRERSADRDLINTAAWGSYIAARRIGSWLR